MFSLSTIATNFASTQKKFKKFGKKLRKQRDGEIDTMKEKLKEIAQDEIERSKNLFEKHKPVLLIEIGDYKNSKIPDFLRDEAGYTCTPESRPEHIFLYV